VPRSGIGSRVFASCALDRAPRVARFFVQGVCGRRELKREFGCCVATTHGLLSVRFLVLNEIAHRERKRCFSDPLGNDDFAQRNAARGRGVARKSSRALRDIISANVTASRGVGAHALQSTLIEKRALKGAYRSRKGPAPNKSGRARDDQDRLRRPQQ